VCVYYVRAQVSTESFAALVDHAVSGLDALELLRRAASVCKDVTALVESGAIPLAT
jgi:hypothetical protein